MLLGHALGQHAFRRERPTAPLSGLVLPHWLLLAERGQAFAACGLTKAAFVRSPVEYEMDVHPALPTLLRDVVGFRRPPDRVSGDELPQQLPGDIP